MYIKIKFNLKVCMVSKYDDEDEDFDLGLAKSIRSLSFAADTYQNHI